MSWDEPVFDKTERSKLQQLTNADCVDMETGYGASLCAQNQIPFLAIRAISDGLNMAAEEMNQESVIKAIWNGTIAAIDKLAPKSQFTGHKNSHKTQYRVRG